MKENPRQTNTEPTKFCREPSRQYLNMLEACGDDPRSVIGTSAIRKSGSLAEKGWVPAWDSREPYHVGR